jgi:hypothetical protein
LLQPTTRQLTAIFPNACFIVLSSATTWVSA